MACTDARAELDASTAPCSTAQSTVQEVLDRLVGASGGECTVEYCDRRWNYGQAAGASVCSEECTGAYVCNVDTRDCELNDAAKIGLIAGFTVLGFLIVAFLIIYFCCCRRGVCKNPKGKPRLVSPRPANFLTCGCGCCDKPCFEPVYYLDPEIRAPTPEIKPVLVQRTPSVSSASTPTPPPTPPPPPSVHDEVLAEIPLGQATSDEYTEMHEDVNGEGAQLGAVMMVTTDLHSPTEYESKTDKSDSD